MTLPTFVSVGAVSTGNPSWGAGHDTDDLGLVFVESSGANPLTTPSGYAVADGFPIILPSTRLSCVYKFAASNAEGAPTITVSGADHTVSAIAVYRGVNKLDPFHQVSGTSSNSGTHKGFVGLTTQLIDILVVNVLGWALDNAGPLRSSGPTNADLGSLTERLDAGTTSGDGGGLYLCDGTKAAKGSFTFTEVDFSSAIVSNMATICLQAADQTFGQKSRIVNTRM